MAYLYDTRSKYINVPCGHCDECISVLQMSIVQRALMESIYNHFFMATLTYNNEHLPKLTLSNGYEYRYADYNHLSILFQRLKNINAFPRGFRTFSVSERGSDRGRPHFHVIFMVPKRPEDTYNWCIAEQFRLHPIILDQWYENLGSKRSPVKDPLCTYVRRFYSGRWHTNYDFHYVNPRFTGEDVAPVAFYVTKYLLKRSDKDYRIQQALKMNLDHEEYLDSWKIIRSRWHSSRYFGFNPTYDPVSRYHKWFLDKRIINYLHKCVQASKGKYPYPCFINPFNGKWFPLAHVYKLNGDIYNVDDATYFVENNPIDVTRFRDYWDLLRHENRFKFLQSVGDSDYFDDTLF